MQESPLPGTALQRRNMLPSPRSTPPEILRSLSRQPFLREHSAIDSRMIKTFENGGGCAAFVVTVVQLCQRRGKWKIWLPLTLTCSSRLQCEKQM